MSSSVDSKSGSLSAWCMALPSCNKGRRRQAWQGFYIFAQPENFDTISAAITGACQAGSG